MGWWLEGVLVRAWEQAGSVGVRVRALRTSRHVDVSWLAWATCGSAGDRLATRGSMAVGGVGRCRRTVGARGGYELAWGTSADELLGEQGIARAREKAIRLGCALAARAW